MLTFGDALRAKRMQRSIQWLKIYLIAVLAIIVAPAHAHDLTDATYVVMGDHDRTIARVLTHATQCPDIHIDGQLYPMIERATPALEPLRTTRTKPVDAKPANFPVRTCEFSIPNGSITVSVAGKSLPLPPLQIRRIVVIGDTGCRIRPADQASQACNDPAQYPFAAIAAAAARWHPDLVVHVGDYLYRENPCPSGQAGCNGSPWGYGYDSWQADFFTPARPLLDTAPWVMVRGNHESCNRAGQGWWRFLDPRPLLIDHDCNLPRNDKLGNYSDAYAVPLGESTQIIVLDTSNTINKPLSNDDPRAVEYRKLYQQLAALSLLADRNFVANHQPVLGVAAQRDELAAQQDNSRQQIKISPGNAGLQSVFAPINPKLFPNNVDVLLSGHVHVWEQLSFANGYPSQFVAGFSGTQEDIVPLPAQLPVNASPFDDAHVDHFSSWVNGFGYMTMERLDAQRWKVQIHDKQGKVVNTCHIDGKSSYCDVNQINSPISIN